VRNAKHERVCRGLETLTVDFRASKHLEIEEQDCESSDHDFKNKDRKLSAHP